MSPTDRDDPDHTGQPEPPEGADKRVPLPSGRALEIAVEDGAEERITVRGKGGVVEIAIRLTDQGPRLLVEAADLDLRASGSISLSCDRFVVRSRVESSISAPDIRIEATEGDLELRANDSVSLEGEEIRLNCDRPDEPPEWMKRQLNTSTPSAVPRTLPASDVSGDGDLAEEMAAGKKDDDPD